MLGKIDTYRETERKYREQAEGSVPGRERDWCLSIANAYADLVLILEQIERRRGADL